MLRQALGTVQEMTSRASLRPAEQERHPALRPTLEGQGNHLRRVLDRASLSLGFGELPLRLLIERDVSDGDVLLQVRHRGDAGYQQDVGR